jgi:hypothetical protein
MKKMNETFKRVTGEAGEDYYCPLNEQTETGPVVEPDACVEASTVERYSGNISVS